MYSLFESGIMQIVIILKIYQELYRAILVLNKDT